MEVLVKDSSGGNSYVLASQLSTGVYTLTITLTTQCITMPIVYGMQDANGNPSIAPSDEHTGLFARDFPNGVAGSNEGHLRTTTFDSNCVKQGEDNTCLGGPTPTPTPTASITVCKFYDKNANGIQDAGEGPLTGWPFCIALRHCRPN